MPNICLSIATNFPNWFSVSNFQVACQVITTKVDKTSYYAAKISTEKKHVPVTLVRSQTGVDVYLHKPDFKQVKETMFTSSVKLKLQIHAKPNNTIKNNGLHLKATEFKGH
ncbi:hypothetical protein D1Z90_19910 [Motilimonas pumila]|uniref:Uncharacterized protein n=1 Tax=Motilimonas pumila TaxID=2303987 RepID=A0A418Y9F7_9GAMM|nr:hypothetical protein D1Z90_19910 [Motilimonas pumila]